MIRRYSRLGIWAAMAAFLLGSLSACDVGGGGTSLADGGIGGTGVIAAGSVTAKGSIFVNGVEYSVAGATFERDGEIEVLSEVEQSTRVGMVLEVKGNLDEGGLTGQASEIVFHDLVEGTIDSSTSESASIKVLTILAQQVVVEDGLTKFDDTLTFANIDSSNGFLEISGFRRADGQIEATYVEVKPAGMFEVVGTVKVVNSSTFTIGNLTVTGSSMPALQDGDTVKAEGTSYNSGSKTLNATSVSLEAAGLSIDDADYAEVEGFVSAVSGPITAGETFLVNGQTVQYSAATKFSGGAAEDLLNGVKIEAEGSLVGGIISAEKIELKENLKLEGPVSGVSGSSFTMTYPDDLSGTTTVEVRVDPAVTEEDTPFADLLSGDYVRVEGRILAGAVGSVLATRFREETPDDRMILQGPVENMNGTIINILGVNIDAVGPDLSREDVQITLTEFFAELQANSSTLVKARHRDNEWDQLDLED